MDREPAQSGRPSRKAGQASQPEPMPPVGSAVITVEIDDYPDEAPRRARAPRQQRTRAPRPAKTPAPAGGAWWNNRPLQTALSAIVVGAVVAFIYHLGGGGSAVPGISGQPTNQPSQSSSQVDPAKVSALMQKISVNPRDTASLQALGDLYFQAGDYQTASLWDQKVLGVDANNVTGLLSDGAAQFNLGNPTAAQKEWLRVVTLDPKQAEAYYDLGFLYLSKTPPDMTKVKAMWNKVVQIDPNSDVAKTVKQHLASLSTAAPSSSASNGR